MGKSKLAGIYKLTFPNGKVYIGRSLHVKARIRAHQKYEESNRLLREAREVWSWEEITVEIIESYPIDINTDKDELDAILDDRERFYIEKYQSNNEKYGYNMFDGGKYGKGYCPTDETKQKLSKANKGRRCSPRSEETKRKISEKNKGRKPAAHCEEARLKAIVGKALSEEHKRKISCNNPKTKKVASYTCDGELVKVYDSCRDAILDVGGDDKRKIQRVIYGIRKKYKNLVWRYYEED